MPDDRGPGRLFAVVPAAGKSIRMGRPKLALTLGDRTVIEHVIGVLRIAGVEHVLVVVGPHVAELVPLGERAGAHVLLLQEETPDMRTTVERGLDWLEQHFSPGAADAWLLVPADHPTLDPAVIGRLLHESQAHPEYSIVIPTCQEMRGHPVFIGWKHVAGIRALPASQTLNAYLRQHAHETLLVPVEAPEVLFDMDRPEDYERLRSTWPLPRE